MVYTGSASFMGIFVPDRMRTNRTQGMDINRITAVCISTQPVIIAISLPDANIDQSTSMVTIFFTTNTRAITVTIVPINL